MTSRDKPIQRQWALDWVVADAARARICERDENQALREIADRVHTPGRQNGARLETHRPDKARKGDVSTAFASHTDPPDLQYQRFAREVAGLLEEAALNKHMPGFVSLASSPCLGEHKARVTRAMGSPAVES